MGLTERDHQTVGFVCVSVLFMLWSQLASPLVGEDKIHYLFIIKNKEEEKEDRDSFAICASSHSISSCYSIASLPVLYCTVLVGT